MSNLLKLLFLKEISGIGNAKINKDYLSEIRQGADLKDLEAMVRGKEAVGEDSVKLAAEKALAMSERIEKDDVIRYLTVLDKEYPDNLKLLGNRKPVLLYYKGSIELFKCPSVAVVGTRIPSAWTSKVEVQLVNKTIEISERVIVSGLALGCDTIAHKTCLDSGGKTIAVLPSGFNQITPEENKTLSEEIISSGGLLLSEYPPEVKASNYTFVERDAIIASLSDATIVVECGKKSGTMHTVEAAHKQCKPLGAYYTEQADKGNYEGNKYILEKKNGLRISDTASLEAFLKKVAAVSNEPVGEQLSLFDL